MKRTVVSLLVLAILAASGVASAKGRVERAYKGKIVPLKKRPPSKFSSDGAWLRFLRANKMTHIWPHKKYKDRWKFEVMAFFNRPLNDMEVKIKFFDVTGKKKFVAADSFYLPRRGQTIFATMVELVKDPFVINRQYEMTMVAPRGNKVLARTKFWLRDKPVTYSGKVEFSEEETKGK